MLKKIAILIFGVSLIALTASADVVNPRSNDFSYVFHLYYDNGSLVGDRDFQFSYDIVGAAYLDPTITVPFPYRGEIINFTGDVAAHFVFDPKGGDVKFTKGKISVRSPYVADGQKAVFYDVSNNAILTIPVSDSSFCNDDNICNADHGEDSLSCPKDCKQSLPAPPPVTSTTTTSQSNGVVRGIIYAVIGLILIGLVWWFFGRRRRPPTPPTPPPYVPPTSNPLPTPPTPPNPGNPV